MTDPAARRVLTELYADQGWPAEGEELLHRSLGPRAPELLLEAPGWLGLDAGQLVLDAGCRDATHAIALARATAAGSWASTWWRRGCPRAGPTVEAAIAAAGFQVARRERIASEWSEYQLEHDPGYLTQDLLETARLTRNRDQLEATLGPNARQSGCASRSNQNGAPNP